MNRVKSTRVKSMGPLAFTVVLAMVCDAATHAGSVIYVDASAAKGGDGQSWQTAFASLQDALAAAVPGSGTQIWVADGEYKPAPPNGDRSTSFQLKSGVELYGGFAGGETSLAERDWVAYPTVLSGDLNGDDVGAIDDASRLENSWRVVVASNVDSLAVLDGFEITAGDTRNGAVNHGAGIFSENSELTIQHCTSYWNYGGYGVGFSSSTALCPTLKDCTFRDNRAYFSGATGAYIRDAASGEITDCVFKSNVGLFAGGLFVRDATMQLARCAFIENVVTRTGGTGAGAGLYIFSGTVAVTDCLFEGNVAASGASGAVNWGTAAFRRCVFQNNAAGFSGGPAIASLGHSNFVDCIFRGNTSKYSGAVVVEDIDLTTFINCLFTGNAADGFGGGIVSISNATTLINCTIATNTAGEQGGGISRFGSATNDPLSIVNCVIWGNSDSTGSGQSAQISGTVHSIQSSCVQGWTGSLGGVGNHGLEPLFVDAVGTDTLPGTEDDNLRLNSGSPCIDVGDNDALPPDIDFDLDGNPRIQSRIIDMGAYEHAPVAPCDGDVAPKGSGNGVIDIDDLLLIVNNWGQTGANPADADGNGVVDIDDLLQVVNGWGPCP